MCHLLTPSFVKTHQSEVGVGSGLPLRPAPLCWISQWEPARRLAAVRGVRRYRRTVGSVTLSDFIT